MPIARVVVVVDNDEPVREMVCAFLVEAGYDAIPAAGGGEAVEVCRSGVRIDVLVTNLELPDIGGLELVNRIRSEQPGTAFLTMSAMGPGGESSVPFIGKPFSVEQFLSAIRDLLGQEKVRRQYS